MHAVYSASLFVAMPSSGWDTSAASRPLRSTTAPAPPMPGLPRDPPSNSRTHSGETGEVPEGSSAGVDLQQPSGGSNGRYSRHASSPLPTGPLGWGLSPLDPARMRLNALLCPCHPAECKHLCLMVRFERLVDRPLRRRRSEAGQETRTPKHSLLATESTGAQQPEHRKNSTDSYFANQQINSHNIPGILSQPRYIHPRSYTRAGRHAQP